MSKHFQEALKKLNPEQRKAVETIEGPVMVIAGPGTGKTQVMAARIGHILNETDASPHNILCLTYTDAATVAMRKRLIQFMGAAAYNIHIYTFHSFCNQVIQDNLRFFGGYRDLQPITDLEKVEVLEAMIDNLDMEHPLKRPTGDRYYERGRLDALFALIKQENWHPKWMKNRIDQYVSELPMNEDFIYKVNMPSRDIKKGDIKRAQYQKEVDQMEMLKAGIDLFSEYNDRLNEIQRYDYHDMISWVLTAFKNHPNLLLDYQEKFQYILVDEYQDTNGAQNNLIYNLSSYWEAPNLFVVGDDDQSIYRFQGANMENILYFKQKFGAHLTEVVLTKNYRSTQPILNASRAVISKGLNRLESRYDHITKELFSQKDPSIVQPKVTNFLNTEHEKAALIQILFEKKENGEDLSKTAVIYRNHAQVAEVVKALEKKNIPIQLKRKINILEDPWIERLIQILRYLTLEMEKPFSGEHLLPEIMHFSFFGIHPYDIAKLSRFCAYKPEEEEGSKRWIDVLHREDQLKSLHLLSYRKIRAFVQNIDKWLESYYNKTTQVLIDDVLTYSGILAEMLQAQDKALKMQMLTTFFDLIKEESRRHKNMKMSQILSTIDKMIKYNITLPVFKYFHQENGVQFVTAHSSKGLEFNHVIILGANTKQWESKSSRNRTYKIPESITGGKSDTKLEDERRLFYVAMTRAEERLDIFYSSENTKSKKLQESRFVVELREDEVILDQSTESGQHLSDDEMIQFGLAQLLDSGASSWSWVDHDVCVQVLEKFRLSVTALNKYLKCPISFYFDSILKVPSARTVFTGFGNAIHLTLEKMHNSYLSTGNYPEKTEVLDIFKNKMDHLHSHFTELEFADYLAYGLKILDRYIDEYSHLWKTTPKFEMEYNVSQAVCGEVPIKGRLDRVELDGDKVTVIDYKTGKVDRGRSKSKPPKDDEDPGHDYWRQMVFYKLLMDNDPKQSWTWRKGYFDFVQPDKKTDKLYQVEVDITPEAERKVTQQIQESWTAIQAHEFETGCGEKDCKWCQFVKFNEIIITESDDDESEALEDPTFIEPLGDS